MLDELLILVGGNLRFLIRILDGNVIVFDGQLMYSLMLFIPFEIVFLSIFSTLLERQFSCFCIQASCDWMKALLLIGE